MSVMGNEKEHPFSITGFKCLDLFPGFSEVDHRSLVVKSSRQHQQDFDEEVCLVPAVLPGDHLPLMLCEIGKSDSEVFKDSGVPSSVGRTEAPFHHKTGKPIEYPSGDQTADGQRTPHPPILQPLSHPHTPIRFVGYNFTQLPLCILEFPQYTNNQYTN